MFSYELTSNSWMYYKFFFPEADWYMAGKYGWRGKSITYNPIGCFYVGWFGAVLDSDWIRTRNYAGVW